MALKLNKSVFFHLGRTGGYSVRTSLKEIGIVTEEIGEFHATPDEIKLETGLSSIAFIRHPLTWLRSLWYHKLVFGVDEYDPQVLSHISEVTPDVFLRYCIENYPNGIVYEYFKSFLTCDFVGRLEYINIDLKDILVKCNEIHTDFNLVVARENESRHSVVQEFKAPLTLLEEYLSTEAHWCEKFGYNNIPDNLIGEGNYVSPLAGGWSNSLYREEISYSKKEVKLASIYRDASPFILGCAFREKMPIADIIAWRVESFDYDNYTYLSNHLRERNRDPLRSYDNFIIAETLRSLNLSGKHVLEIQCGDGFHSVSAERFGANKVVSIDEDDQDLFSDFVIPFLKSNIVFKKTTCFDVSIKSKEKFDILIANNFQKITKDLNSYFSQLSLLLSNDGCLLLGCEVISEFNGIPLVFFPNEDQSPTGGVAYMTLTYLLQILAEHKFVNISMIAQLNIGLDNPKEFINLPFKNQDMESISRTSIIDKIHLLAFKSAEGIQIS